MRQVIAQNTVERIQFDRLGKEIIKSSLDKSFPHTIDRIGSQCNDRQFFIICIRHIPDDTRCLYTIHLRHHMIHEHQINIL